MAAGKHGAGFGDLVQGAGDDLIQLFGWKLFGWKTDQVEADFRLASHGVNVTDRIGGGDLTEAVWIVYRRGDEISREDDGQIIGETIDSGIITGGIAHQ